METKTLQLNFEFPVDQFAELTAAAQKLGYRDVQDFLEDQSQKVLSALSLPYEEQWSVKKMGK